MKTLNIGILAHVDAGKTSLTERLLFNAGVIKTLGSVDKGNTQTDTMALERQRGITIKAAVTSFNIGDLKINLIDTPGHPDFIAEVERSLRILDAVILVISAVEGIQPQTHILARTLKKLNIPTIIFINKIDRMGARSTDLVEAIKARLFSDASPVNKVADIGTRHATVVSLQPNAQARDIARFQPIFFGSALTGVGVPELTNALERYGKADNDPHTPLSATIFKIERGSRGEKIAYIRMYGGELRAHKTLELHRMSANSEPVSITSKITALQLFKDGKAIDVQEATLGDIVKVWGLNEAKIGDYIGHMPTLARAVSFAPPSLEVVIKPRNNADRPKLHKALEQMSEQDPLIQMQQTEQGVISVKLYGEVQCEVIKALLHDEYGLEVLFEETQTIYVEKVLGTGASYAEKFAPDNIFIATLGFRITLGETDNGIVFKPDAGIGRIPVSYMKIVEEMVFKTLRQGFYGWEVIECIVEITHAGYESAMSTGTDFRRLTPLLIAEALQKAGTEVYEPMNHFELDIPSVTLPKVLQSLVSAEAILGTTATEREVSHIEGMLPVRQTFDLEKSIPDLTSGEGVFIAVFVGYQKARGKTPTKKRTDNNPFNKEEYLRRTLKRN
jgi:ribosomal protection tetracycline resistance protein